MKSPLSKLMPKEQTPEEKRREMIERPVVPLILSLAAPSIFANVVNTLYNLADTYFVGQMGSTSASAAVRRNFLPFPDFFSGPFPPVGFGFFGS